MVNGLRILLRRIGPGLEHFENEQVVAVDQPPIGDSAFEIGETLRHEWRRHALGRERRQVDRGELIEIAARRISDLTHLRRQPARRSCNWRYWKRRPPAAARTRPSCARTWS